MALNQQQKDLILKVLSASAKKNTLVSEVTIKE